MNGRMIEAQITISVCDFITDYMIVCSEWNDYDENQHEGMGCLNTSKKYKRFFLLNRYTVAPNI